MLPSDGVLHTYHGCFSTKTPNDSPVTRLGRALRGGGDEEVKGLTQDLPKESLKLWFLIRSDAMLRGIKHDPKQSPSQEGGLGACCSMFLGC